MAYASGEGGAGGDPVINANNGGFGQPNPVQLQQAINADLASAGLLGPKIDLGPVALFVGLILVVGVVLKR